MSLTYPTYQRLQSELVTFDHTYPHPAYFLAVDFDAMIIHAERYTWDDWCNTGKRTYPACEPIRVEFVEVNAGCFTGFVDMRSSKETI